MNLTNALKISKTEQILERKEKMYIVPKASLVTDGIEYIATEYSSGIIIHHGIPLQRVNGDARIELASNFNWEPLI